MSLKTLCLVVYIVLFFIGGCVHLVHVVEDGWLPYNYVPQWINFYWTSLLFLDFAAVWLLLLHRNFGLILALLIMLSDVAVNTHAHGLNGGPIYWGYIVQTMFLGFIFGTIGFLWEGSDLEAA